MKELFIKSFVFNYTMNNKWEEYFLNFIDTFKDKIDWLEMSCNPNITVKMINENPNLSWNQYKIMENPNLTIDVVKQYTHSEWRWTIISYNPNITIYIILSNLHLPWDWRAISGSKKTYYGNITK